MYYDVLKIFFLLVLGFSIGILLTPTLSFYMYRYRLWKKSGRSNQKENPQISKDFSAIHNLQAEISTPRVGGVVIWLTVFCTAMILWVLSRFFEIPFFDSLDFVSRKETWLLFFALFTASGIGLVDDLLQIFGSQKTERHVDGLSRMQRIGLVSLIASIGAWWLYVKLGFATLVVPFFGTLSLGWLFVPLFILVTLAVFSSGVIDGIDGLAGGVFATQFAAYATIAFFQGQYDIAGFCAVMVAGISAFLWFNVPPARFYMGETGTLGLTITLALVAFLTHQVLVLIIIGLPLVATSMSVILQMFARRLFKKKVFLVAPLHHHFQALGWSREKITMRYWIVSIITSVLGIIIAILGS